MLQRSIIRASSICVAGVLALLILTSVLPPIVADQSDRAVVNAPVVLVTSPIAGEVYGLPIKAGQELSAGQIFARVRNTRVDRSTLISLEGKVADNREKAAATKRKKDADLQYVALLDAELRQQSTQLQVQLTQQVAEIRSRIAAASSASNEKKFALDRQSDLVARNVASPDMRKMADVQYTGSLHQQDAETSRLTQKQTQLEGLKKGVFVGDELVGLAALAQKRRDIAFDAERLAIEEIELSANLRDQEHQLTAERQRLDRLSDGEVGAPMAGTIFSVGASTGRHVSAGDSLATMVNCDQAFVVSIFSYRQAQSLTAGTRVQVTSSDRQFPLSGTVREILPKTSDKSDDQFAVAFPQTERRELYVLITLDDRPAVAGEVEARETSACGVGRWVTVTRENGWVPSMSVLWSTAAPGAADVVRNAGASVVDTAQRAITLAVSSARDFVDQNRAFAAPDRERSTPADPH